MDPAESSPGDVSPLTPFPFPFSSPAPAPVTFPCCCRSCSCTGNFAYSLEGLGNTLRDRDRPPRALGHNRDVLSLSLSFSPSGNFNLQPCSHATRSSDQFDDNIRTRDKAHLREFTACDSHVFVRVIHCNECFLNYASTCVCTCDSFL